MELEGVLGSKHWSTSFSLSFLLNRTLICKRKGNKNSSLRALEEIYCSEPEKKKNLPSEKAQFTITCRKTVKSSPAAQRKKV